MHGIVFAELKKFVDTTFDPTVWAELLKSSGLDGKIYLPTQPYPDEDIIELVSQACIRSGLSKEELLDQFGQFIVPDLLSIFNYAIQPSWKTLDLIENVESVIHKAVRINNKGAVPPKLTVSRVSQSVVEIIYQSPRRMEHLGVGIIKGIAAYFKEKVVVNCKVLTPETSLISIKVRALLLHNSFREKKFTSCKRLGKSDFN